VLLSNTAAIEPLIPEPSLGEPSPAAILLLSAAFARRPARGKLPPPRSYLHPQPPPLFFHAARPSPLQIYALVVA
jgi:hypothetical protein